MNKHTSPHPDPSMSAEEAVPEPAPAPATPRAGRIGFLKNARSRTPWVDTKLWASLPTPRSAFVRQALEAYLATSPADLRADPGVQRNNHGVYLTNELWNGLQDLPGDAHAHLEAALRAALERGHG